MPSPRPATATLRPALLLIGALTLLRLAYVVWFCPYDLIEDEAHYWLWAQRLDWSYYSKGPGVAWAIAAATRVLGDAEWAVRVPAVLASALGAAAVAGLARDVSARGWRPGAAAPARVAVFAALAFTLAPAFQFTAWLMTIDGPYVACWAAACWAFWRAAEGRSRAAWPACGLALAARFLFKYTALLLIPGLALYGLARRRRLSLARGWPWWLAGAALLVLLGLAPVLWWNHANGWPTVRHLLGHLGAAGGDMPESKEHWEPAWTLEFLAGQIAFVGPAVVLAIGAAVHAVRTRATEPDAWPGRLFLLCCGAPILLFYIAVSFVANPEHNWALGAYPTLLALAGWYAADMSEPRAVRPARWRRPRLHWKLTVAFTLLAAVFVHRADLLASGINRTVAWEPYRRLIHGLLGRDPRPVAFGRLMGARAMGEQVRELAEDLRRQTGRDAIVIAQHYGRASQMAYYAAGPGLGDAPPPGLEVFSDGPLLMGRRTQFDLWPETSLRRPDLVGRPAVLLSNQEKWVRETWERLLDSVRLVGPDGRLDGEHKKDRVAYTGLNFRGLPRQEPARQTRGQE